MEWGEKFLKLYREEKVFFGNIAKSLVPLLLLTFCKILSRSEARRTRRKRKKRRKRRKRRKRKRRKIEEEEEKEEGNALERKLTVEGITLENCKIHFHCSFACTYYYSYGYQPSLFPKSTPMFMVSSTTHAIPRAFAYPSSFNASVS